MDRIFQNIRADFLEILEISEILEILEISEILEIKILEIRKVRGENLRADRHPSDDRPCTTTQSRGHGLSTGGGDHIYIYTDRWQ